VPAKTKWWLCGNCAFENHPRGQKQNSLNINSGQHDNELCEQCGAPSSHPDAVDYTPGGR
jgi:hypothetical protein